MTPEELELEFVTLAQSGELDKIQMYLRARRDKVPREVVREIVQEACLEVVRRQQDGGRITNVAGLITTIARRQQDKVWKEMLEGAEIDSALARREAEGGEWCHDDQWQAKVERATEYIFKVVAGWPTDNLRRTLLTIIDAAAQGVQLESRDLDRVLECAHGTGRVWRDRAFDRLRVQLEKDGISWDEVTGALTGINEVPEDESDIFNTYDANEEES